MKLHLAILLPRFALSRISADQPPLEFAINLRASEDIRLIVNPREPRV